MHFTKASCSRGATCAPACRGRDLGFDPLDILLQEAHGRGLSVEAWLNPYRLRSSAAMPPNLAENNLANTHPEWVCAVGDGLI